MIPAAALIALLFAWYFFRQMKRQDEGTERMKEIARYVREGAMAYLRQQYKVVVIVFIVLALFFAWLAFGLGVVRFPDGRFLFGARRFHRHEDSYLCVV